MSLLFPLYLLGAAAITLPILLHRRRQHPKERTQFSSLMFLEATPPRVKTRTRIENLLLLFLRCLAFLTLTLCFARPFLPNQDDLAGGMINERVLILLDNSEPNLYRINQDIIKSNFKNTVFSSVLVDVCDYNFLKKLFSSPISSEKVEAEFQSDLRRSRWHP